MVFPNYKIKNLIFYFKKMGRKKRDLSYLKPFCYYCDKEFNNEIVLH